MGEGGAPLMNSCITLVIILLIFSHFLVLCHIHVRRSSFIIRCSSLVVRCSNVGSQVFY